MNDIQILRKSELCGRQFTVYGTAENPLFLAKEVAEIIEHSDSNKMIQSVDSEEKVRNIVPTLGGPQEMWLLTEDGLYEVLMQSRKPIAKTFKKGVKQILHEVRINGGYLATTTEDTPELIMAKALKLADATIQRVQEQNRLLTATAQAQARKIEEDKPKVVIAECLAASKDSSYINEFAKFLGAKGVRLTIKGKDGRDTTVKCGEIHFYAWLRQNKYLGVSSDTYNRPIGRFTKLFESNPKPYIDGNGMSRTGYVTKVTPKGQEYFIQKLVYEIQEPALF